MPLTTGAKKIKVAKALLKGKPESIEGLGRQYFLTDHPYCCQQNYLRYHLFMVDIPLKEFKAELLKHNNYLWYFLVPDKFAQ